jgi:phage regulator Rha-like protein
MSKKEIKEVSVPIEKITGKIYLIRGQKVMLDRDLAELYQVETKQLKRAVRRNIDRFPADFMFELTKAELENWRCQFGTSKSETKGLRYKPLAFTEQGVAMLSSILRSKRAVQVNIQIMRAFNQLRKMLVTHKDLKRKIEVMEKKYDEQFRIVFEAITQLIAEDEKPKKKIGYLKERQAKYGKSRRKN